MTCRLKIQFSVTFVRKFTLLDEISRHLFPRSSKLEVAYDESHPKEREKRRRETKEICSTNSDDVYFP